MPDVAEMCEVAFVPHFTFFKVLMPSSPHGDLVFSHNDPVAQGEAVSDSFMSITAMLQRP